MIRYTMYALVVLSYTTFFVLASPPRRHGHSHEPPEASDPDTGLKFSEALIDTTSRLQNWKSGDPISFSPDELAIFDEGKDKFEEEDEIEEGLGPVFNDVSCAACHNLPATGGSGTRLSTRIGAIVHGEFDPLIEFGGPVLQKAAIGDVDSPNGPHTFVPEVIPPEATIVANRRATPTFGFGYVDSLSKKTLLFLQTQEAKQFPDTAGIMNIVASQIDGSPEPGKFGWGAGISSTISFSADARKQELGVSTEGTLNDSDACPQGNCDELQFNPVEDPNEDIEEVIQYANFMDRLRPPPRNYLAALSKSEQDKLRASCRTDSEFARRIMPYLNRVFIGQKIFYSCGCNRCHTPTLIGGNSEVGGVEGVKFHPYSDFLLHDMGELGDGIVQGLKTGTMMRTQPLWGLHDIPEFEQNGKTLRFLHDGRAKTLDEAIELHGLPGSQGISSVKKWKSLDRQERALLNYFLNSL